MKFLQLAISVIIESLAGELGFILSSVTWWSFSIRLVTPRAINVLLSHCFTEKGPLLLIVFVFIDARLIRTSRKVVWKLGITVLMIGLVSFDWSVRAQNSWEVRSHSACGQILSNIWPKKDESWDYFNTFHLTVR